MPETVLVEARFNGPRESGNGGYSAGLLAAALGAEAAEVTLRSPVPLDVPLRLEGDGAAARALDGETLVAEMRADPGFAPDVPAAPSVAEAREAMRGYRGQRGGEFSRCFVCGLDRPDAFGVFAGPLEGRDAVASTWTPDPSLAGADGNLRPEAVWAVLDCPTYFAAFRGEEGALAFLGRITGRVDAPVAPGAEHVVLAWPLGVEGRKREAGSAVLSADGEVLARARVLMIEPRQEQMR